MVTYDQGAVPSWTSKSKCRRRVRIPETSKQSLIIPVKGTFMPLLKIPEKFLENEERLSKITTKFSMDELRTAVQSGNEILKNSYMPRNFLCVFVLTLFGLALTLFYFYMAGGIILGILSSLGGVYVFQVNRTMPQENHRAFATLAYTLNRRTYWSRKSRVRPGFHALWLEFQFEYSPISELLSTDDCDLFGHYLGIGETLPDESPKKMGDVVAAVRRSRTSIVPLSNVRPERRSQTIMMVRHEQKSWEIRNPKRRWRTDYPRRTLTGELKGLRIPKSLSPIKDSVDEKMARSPWSGGFSAADTEMTDGSMSPMTLGHNLVSTGSWQRSGSYIAEGDVSPEHKSSIEAAQYLFVDDVSGDSSGSENHDDDKDDDSGSPRSSSLAKTLKSASTLKCDEEWINAKVSAIELRKVDASEDLEELKIASLEIEHRTECWGLEEFPTASTAHFDEKFREYDVQDQLKIDELVTLEDHTESSIDDHNLSQSNQVHDFNHQESLGLGLIGAPTTSDVEIVDSRKTEAVFEQCQFVAKEAIRKVHQ